jgi:hypothetical protein
VKKQTIIMLVVSAGLLAAGCESTPSQSSSEDQSLVGAWRAQIHFKSGAFTAFKDLEFMYVFNDGGTMTESSNYDAAPPVPPAYGVWRKTGPKQFEVKYTFFVTKAPTGFEDIAKGGGWMPAGHGVFMETITLSDDGKSFKSTMKYEQFDQAGKPVEGGGEAEVEGVSVSF